jgi:hypothetical protein
MRPESYAWNEAEKGQVHQRLMSYVEAVERAQSDVYNRFIRLAWLYDPHRRPSDVFEEERRVGSQARVQENVIASNCDTITGVIASVDIRARFMTDGAEWSVQRRARQLELYSEELSKLLGFDVIGERCFHEGSLKGTSLAFVGVDRHGKLCAERVMPDEIVVDQQEANGGEPRQMEWRKLVPKTLLIAKHPKHAEQIRAAQSGRGGAKWAYWADYRPIDRDEIVFIRAWHLPIGEEGEEGYVPGRYVECIDGCDLIDEEYNKHHFPFAVFRWTPRPDGWFGIGGAERIVGHQRTLNKLNWQIDRQIQQYAVPTTWVHQTDQNLQVKTVNQFGTLGVYKVKEPKTVFPPSVSPETYKRRDDVIGSAHREFGQSQMATGAMKPAGLDSGVALREYKDQTTDRFAIQEKEFERFKLRLIWLALDCCKDMAAAGMEPPEVTRKTRRGRKKLRWSDVDMGEVQVQMVAASNLARTPAGRMQLVMEFAQSGVISQDEARRLLQHPDLERALSLYTAAMEYVEYCLEDILDGQVVVPSTQMNLKMCVWRGEAQYQLSAMDGAPEDVLETLHQFVTLAAYQISLSEQPAMVAPPMNANMPMDPAMAGAVDPMTGLPAAPMAPATPGAPVTGAGVEPLMLAG